MGGNDSGIVKLLPAPKDMRHREPHIERIVADTLSLLSKCQHPNASYIDENINKIDIKGRYFTERLVMCPDCRIDETVVIYRKTE